VAGDAGREACEWWLKEAAELWLRHVENSGSDSFRSGSDPRGAAAMRAWACHYFAMPDDSGLDAVLQDDAAVQWALGRAHHRVLGCAAAQEG
jgi:hypothetical protein